MLILNREENLKNLEAWSIKKCLKLNMPKMPKIEEK
jgi:hypothetical protein